MNLSSDDTMLQSREEQERPQSDIGQELHPHFESEQSYLVREVQNLRTRNAWLTGAVVALFLGLGGLGTWFVLTQQASQQQANLEESNPVQDSIDSRIQQLEQDIEALRSQVPADLLESLSINQGAIQRVEAQLQQLINKLNGLQSDPSSPQIPSNSSELDELLEDEPLNDESSSPVDPGSPSENPNSNKTNSNKTN